MTVILSDLLITALNEIKDSKTLAGLDDIRVRYLGKKGKITTQLKLLGSMDPNEKPIFGQEINATKKRVEDELQLKKTELKKSTIAKNIETSSIDVTLPGRAYLSGSIHPITATLMEIENIFLSAGFSIEDGPEIENEYYNFSALNIPENHPARAMHDTFYVGSDLLLRTHTSPVQIRSMKKKVFQLR